MIKKIIFLLILLFTAFCLLFFVFLDKVFIQKTIEGIEKDLKVKISLNEDHKLIFFPNLSLLTKFNLKNKNYNLFIKNAELEIYKNYDLKPAKFIFNSEKLEIKNFFIEQLVAEGKINRIKRGDFKSKFEILPKGDIYFHLNSNEINSLNFLRLIFKRLNIPDTYKQLFDFTFNILREKSFFSSKIIFDEALVIIDYFESNKNDFNFNLNGTFNLQTNILNLKADLNHMNENVVELKITENINNPNIEIVSNDNLINLNFTINEFDKILDDGIENILSDIITDE